jgi:hypothetical protein
MDVILDSESNIVNISYCNALIKVFKNYRYEEDDLLKDTDYHYLLETTGAMTQRYKYITNIRNSHDVVCYLMIFMNYYCAKEFLKYNNGIFRTTIIKQPINIKQPIKNTLLDDVLLPDDVRKYIQIWNSISGQYVDLNVIPADSIEILTRHELLEIDAYIHITSPIRRLVDLLNMIKLQQNMGLIVLSDEATQFYEKWIKQLDYINITMRAIRKIQHECTLLATCFENPEILDKEYEGYCFDKLVRNDGLYQFIVYLPELKLTSKITIREDLGNYEKRIYKLFLFSDEEKFKKKIRLQFIR